MTADVTLSVLTLNVWGLPGNFACDKRKRIEAISQALCDLKYDILCLQEVWTKSDYRDIKERISDSYPYHHYFYSGLLGSGLCIFSKWPIEECFYYRFPLNGYFHMIHHGDWCGGKGVGVAQINVLGIIVNVFNTHLHAQYSLTDSADDYLAHRVVQAFDAALFIKLTSQSADVSILAGDLNAEPTSLCKKIITCVANLEDVYHIAATKELKAETNDCFRNSYRNKSLEISFPGRRIDYVLIKSKDHIKVNVLSCTFPLDARVPNKSFSYSDHEAVGTSFSIQNLQPFQSNHFDEKKLCQKECLESALLVCEKELLHIKKNIRHHTWLMGLVFILFPFLFFNVNYKGIICTTTTLSLGFCLLMITAEYQNYSWIKNAKKRIKLMSNQFKKHN